MIWEHLTTLEIDAIDRRIPVVLPMAAIEQHGPHLPIATDRMIGEHFCQRLDESIPHEVLILPMMAVGCSEHHMDFAGSLSLQHTTFLHQAEDILHSVIQYGFTNLLILNSHGGNQAIGQVLLERIGRTYPDCLFVFTTWWKAIMPDALKMNSTGEGGVGHAGEFETSLMLHIAPDLVKQPLPEGGNITTYPWANMDMLRGPKAMLYRTMKEMTPNGVFGNPTSSTAEQGKAISDLVVDTLKGIVFDLYK